jgi:hypothetical protein
VTRCVPKDAQSTRPKGFRFVGTASALRRGCIPITSFKSSVHAPPACSGAGLPFPPAATPASWLTGGWLIGLPHNPVARIQTKLMAFGTTTGAPCRPQVSPPPPSKMMLPSSLTKGKPAVRQLGIGAYQCLQVLKLCAKPMLRKLCCTPKEHIAPQPGQPPFKRCRHPRRQSQALRGMPPRPAAAAAAVARVSSYPAARRRAPVGCRTRQRPQA